MPVRSTGSATISFGLVSIPVKVYTAISPRGTSFHMLHRACGTRIKMQFYCPFDNEIVERKETVKGFEQAKDQYVRFEEAELKALDTPKTEQLDIQEFVPDDAIDQVFVEHTHYLGAGKGGDRAYRLLVDSMVRKNKVALAQYWTHGKTEIVALRPYQGGLLMQHLFYANEVRPFDEVPLPGKIAFKKAEEELAEKLVQQLSSKTFDPTKYHDDYGERVAAAVEEKIAGREVVVPPAAPQAQVIDLFEALKRSLGDGAANANAAMRRAKPLKKASPRKPVRAKKAAG